MTWQIKWREMSNLLQTVPSLCVCVCVCVCARARAVFHLNTEIPSDPQCIRRIDQFIPGMGQHFFAFIILTQRVAETSTDIL